MKVRNAFLVLALAVALSSTVTFPSAAQSVSGQPATPVAASAPTAVPALVPYAGSALTTDGRSIAAETSITFLIYKDEQGGEPLFVETQSVAIDPSGHYKVQLGATNPNGLPAALFLNGEARWLEAQIAGQALQPRVLLASVPYALKAADAATLGGLPASAFALAGASGAFNGTAGANGVSPALTSAVTTTGGTVGHVPAFSGTSTIVDSPIVVSTTKVSVGTSAANLGLEINGTMTVNGGSSYNGQLLLPAAGTATATTSFNSQLIKLYTSAYNSATKAAVSPRFQWQAEVNGNNTASPAGTLNLFSSTTATPPIETGFYFNANGTLHFAPGQTFPGTGAGTITAVTAGTALKGGGTSGNVTLNLDTTKVPLLAASNSFTGDQAVSGSITSGASLFLPNTRNVNVGVVQLGPTPFLSNYGPAGGGNVFVGGAGNFTTTGPSNTAVGYVALHSNTTGNSNNAFGDFALASVTTGSGNTAVGSSALQSATTGVSNVAVGGAALYGLTTGCCNIAVGVSALQSTTKGIDNTAVGADALFANTTGNYNNALGDFALFSLTTGSSNTAVGSSALQSATTGLNNVAVGGAALFGATTASGNTAIGSSAMQNATIGGSNTAVGGGSLYSTSTGGNNSALGSSALSTNTTGGSNSAFGVGAGKTIDGSDGTGSNNTAVGANSTFGTGNLTNATAIGASSAVTRSNTLVLGCMAGTNGCPAPVSVGIGTTTPSSLLTVNGSITIAKSGSGIVFADGTTLTTAAASVTRYSMCVSGSASQVVCTCGHTDAQVQVSGGASCTANVPNGCTATTVSGFPTGPGTYGVCCACH